MVDVNISKEDVVSFSAGLLVVPCAPDHASTALESISQASGLDVLALASEEKFECKAGQTFLLRGLKGLGTHRVLLVGLGEPADREIDTIRSAGASAARIANEVRASTVGILAPPDSADTLQLIEGTLLGTYAFDRYLTLAEDHFPGVESISVLTRLELDAEVATARIVSDGVCLARDLVNETPNHLTPAAMATRARDIGSTYDLATTIFDEDDLESKGFELIMAVGKGSVHAPRLIHLVYRPTGEVKHKVAFVGKGVTFDTGGYNIKPGGSMLAMHSDMGGAAAVLGAARVIGELKPEGVEVHFVVPSAENSISGNAMKPQDIFRGYGNQTVEIHNTDAEGRLILADALAYIQESNPDVIVDLATLTGACVVALGETTAGLFTDSDELANGLLGASNTVGEDIWRMPLTKKLDKLIDTPTADMKNVGPRWGGAITAALFLGRWVKDYKGQWAHLDIAGPAYSESEGPLAPAGGTGFAVATLVQLVLNKAAS